MKLCIFSKIIFIIIFILVLFLSLNIFEDVLVHKLLRITIEKLVINISILEQWLESPIFFKMGNEHATYLGKSEYLAKSASGAFFRKSYHFIISPFLSQNIFRDIIVPMTSRWRHIIQCDCKIYKQILKNWSLYPIIN